MIEVELPGVDRKKAGSLTQEAARRSLLTLWADSVPKKVQACRFRITAGPDECACGLLAKDSKTKGENLVLEAAKLPQLAATLKFLAEKQRDGIIFHSYYVSVDRPPVSDRRISMKELLTIIAGGTVGNGARYIAC